ncbi:MAG: gliding motility-associated C-terminal domain-containing protein [Bacteroidota bacterium]
MIHAKLFGLPYGVLSSFTCLTLLKIISLANKEMPDMILNKTKHSIFAILLLWSSMATAQICTGNLGDNIFEEGDFGEGSSNNILEDPDIAPGYQYDRIGPPSDGFYTITNNTGGWSNLYGTWMTLRDNSSDPNGYMMVVNASFTQGNFYEQIIDGLCENTLYVFSADIINVVRKPVTGHHNPNVSFLLNDEIKYNTGEIGQTEQWNTYGFTFSTGSGETSLKLTLRNNAPGGIGNDLALDNITFRPCGPEALILPREIANICEDGDPIRLEATIVGAQYDIPAYQWQRSFDEGETWEDIPNATESSILHTERVSGFYYYRYILANNPDNVANSKCRVNSNVKIVQVVPKFYEIVDTLCQGLTFEVGTSVYNTTGIYTDSLISSLGCDSIVTLDLTIVPDQNISADIDFIDPTCFGYEDAEIHIFDVQNGYAPLQLELIGEFPDSIGVFRNLGSGFYDIRITDHFGCSFEANVELIDPKPFEINLGEDLTIDLGDGITLNLVGNYEISSLKWSPEEAVLCPTDCLNEEWFPRATNFYALEAISENGCTASDSIKVVVLPARKLYFPNVFSPNSNTQENTRFTIFGAEPNVQRIISLRIFDRWGNFIFQQDDFAPNDAAQGWDGTLSGELLPSGVYTFVVEVLFFDEAVEVFSGDVLLLGNL